MPKCGCVGWLIVGSDNHVKAASGSVNHDELMEAHAPRNEAVLVLVMPGRRGVLRSASAEDTMHDMPSPASARSCAVGRRRR